MSADLPDVNELLQHAYVVTLPLKVKFRGVTQREVMLIEGPAGWGEFSPFLEYGPAEAARWLQAGIEAAYRPFPEPRRQQIPVNATLPAVPADQVEQVLANYDDPHTIKIKVAEDGQSLADDLARVRRARELFPTAALRVDANAGWTHEQALAALEQLSEFDLQYAEQPVPGIHGLAELRAALRQRGNSLKIAADEAVRKHDDPLEVSRLGAADLMVIKAQPLGGIAAVLEIARQTRLDVVVSSALDSSVGLAQAAALAATLESLPYACGLSTGSLFERDVTGEPLHATAGYLPVRRVAPDRSLLNAYRAEPERERWWQQRLIRCHEEFHRSVN